jgi:hypothetical protein
VVYPASIGVHSSDTNAAAPGRTDVPTAGGDTHLRLGGYHRIMSLSTSSPITAPLSLSGMPLDCLLGARWPALAGSESRATVARGRSVLERMGPPGGFTEVPPAGPGPGP